MNGIDISMFQSAINFNNIPAEIKYVYIKATEGVDYVDPSFISLYNKVKVTNKKFGFYHFFSEKTDPAKQAEDFYNAIKGKNYSLIPVLDVERNNKRRSKSQVTDRVLTFLNRFKALSGIDCIIYTYTSFEKESLDSRVANYKCWIANYNGGSHYPAPIIFKSYVGHQFSENATIKGFNGTLDADNFTDQIELKNASNVAHVNQQSVKVNYHLRDWQKAYNDTYGRKILVDGIYGSQTEDALRKTIVKKGQKNPLVGWLQIRIGAGVDNIFGQNTYDKLIEYQRKNKLAVDGIAGYNTFKKLLSQFTK